ncbi:MAG: hypothetical protein E7F65_04680, partial [Alloscardovia omnicolens]|nr:hypothetical protein [Alloscardovia omnicolens]
ATYVDEGVTLKRFRARAQGRAGRINKRTTGACSSSRCCTLLRKTQ